MQTLEIDNALIAELKDKTYTAMAQGWGQEYAQPHEGLGGGAILYRGTDLAAAYDALRRHEKEVDVLRRQASMRDASYGSTVIVQGTAIDEHGRESYCGYRLTLPPKLNRR